MKILVQHYYDFFDKKLENGTMIIFIIAALITLAGISINDEKSDFQLQANVLEAKK